MFTQDLQRSDNASMAIRNDTTKAAIATTGLAKHSNNANPATSLIAPNHPSGVRLSESTRLNNGGA